MLRMTRTYVISLPIDVPTCTLGSEQHFNVAEHEPRLAVKITDHIDRHPLTGRSQSKPLKPVSALCFLYA
jgi:hypothetical protein